MTDKYAGTLEVNIGLDLVSMRRLGAIVIAVLGSWLFTGAALAEKRVALVIGNSAYRSVPRLANPANDAKIVGTMFMNAGFESVDTKLDLNVVEMRKALREFGAKTRDADVAVIYYAGHGIELDGNNYLIPTDATLETDTDVLDETFPLDRVMFAIEPARQLRLVILDACRDNPFAKTMKRTVATRAIGRGLAKIEPSSPNTMIAFAAKAGSTASDGDSKNSPYAAAVVEHLVKPGLDLRKAFGYVRDDVLKRTGNKQEPYVYGSLGGDDVPLVPAKPAAAPPANSQADMRRDYESAERVGTREVWTAFIAQYPDGLYAALAKGQLSKIATEEVRVAATEKARLAQEEKARLAAEGAKQAEQAKAAAQAKAAEEARRVAEKTEQIERAKVATAEQARLAAEKAAAEKAAGTISTTEKAEVEKSATDKPAAKTAQAASSPVGSPAAAPGTSQLASLTPPAEPVEPEKSAVRGELIKQVKKELQRVGCYAGAIDEKWATAKDSLGRFIKLAKLSSASEEPGPDLLDIIRSKQERVCPMECSRLQVESNGQCVAKTCPAGSVLDNDGSCEKRPPKSAVRTSPDSDPAAGAKPERSTTSSGNALKESFKVMGPGTIQTGRSMTFTGPSGRRMTCIGGDNARGMERSCVWN